jgi:hypothetical protein
MLAPPPDPVASDFQHTLDQRDSILYELTKPPTVNVSRVQHQVIGKKKQSSTLTQDVSKSAGVVHKLPNNNLFDEPPWPPEMPSRRSANAYNP